MSDVVTTAKLPVSSVVKENDPSLEVNVHFSLESSKPLLLASMNTFAVESGPSIATPEYVVPLSSLLVLKQPDSPNANIVKTELDVIFLIARSNRSLFSNELSATSEKLSFIIPIPCLIFYIIKEPSSSTSPF